MSPQTY